MGCEGGYVGLTPAKITPENEGVKTWETSAKIMEE